MEQHHTLYQKGASPLSHRIHGPFPQIFCRDSHSYQSCNFSRFVPIWLIYINALTPGQFLDSEVITTLDYSEVPKRYRNKNLTNPTKLENYDFLEKYKNHVYTIIHSGYNVFSDTKEILPEAEKYIDGTHIFSRPVTTSAPANEHIGYCPDIPQLSNSDYMADYMGPFIDQIKSWIGQHACVSLDQHPSYLQTPAAGHLTLKTTIEPSKPRLCYNARPLAGIMKRLPCKLDDLSVLLPLLKKGMYGCVSDDKQGKPQIVTWQLQILKINAVINT